MRKPAASAENSAPLLRMPAEWETHAATWLGLLHLRGDWQGKFEPISWVYAEIIRYLSRRERVELIVKDSAAEKVARKTLKRAHALNDNIRFHRWPTNRVWVRDSGCAFVVRELWEGTALSRAVAQGEQCKDTTKSRARPNLSATNLSLRAMESAGSVTSLAAIKWRFNAWAKYPNWKHDEKI